MTYAGHDERLRAFDEFLHAYEVAHGEITDAEMDEAERDYRSRARVVRSVRPA